MEKSLTYSEDEVKEIIRKTVDQTSPLFHDNLKLKMADEIFEKLKKKEERVFYRVCNQLPPYNERPWEIEALTKEDSIANIIKDKINFVE